MSYREQLNPWVVYRLLPNCQRVLLERFRKRNDAEEYLAAMKRLAPGSTFEITFEPHSDLPAVDRTVEEAMRFSPNQPLSQSISPDSGYRNLL